MKLHRGDRCRGPDLPLKYIQPRKVVINFALLPSMEKFIKMQAYVRRVLHDLRAEPDQAGLEVMRGLAQFAVELIEKDGCDDEQDEQAALDLCTPENALRACVETFLIPDFVTGEVTGDAADVLTYGWKAFEGINGSGSSVVFVRSITNSLMYQWS
jgi:hypothetical protein